MVQNGVLEARREINENEWCFIPLEEWAIEQYHKQLSAFLCTKRSHKESLRSSQLDLL